MNTVPGTENASAPSNRSRSSSRQHIPALDGVRAIAVLMVICFHFSQGFGGSSHGLMQRMAVWGQTGVDLFFVLSGFLITGILLDSKDSPHFLRNFYVRRMLRIFPLYYGTLLMYYAVLPLLHLNAWVPWKQSFWYWFYLQNFPATFDPKALGPGPGHFWSLAVEEHFYLLWPFLVLKLDRARLMKATGFAVALALITRVVLLHYGTFYFTPARFDGLAIGAALAIFTRTQPDGLAPLVRASRWLLLGLCPVLGAMQLLISGSHLTAVQTVKSTLVAVMYGCVMVLAIENRFGRAVGGALGGRILGSIGKYSYGMYVFHPFVLGWLAHAGLSWGFRGLAEVMVATYLVAWVSWTLFEKRFLRLKRFFEYRTDDLAGPLAAGSRPL